MMAGPVFSRRALLLAAGTFPLTSCVAHITEPRTVQLVTFNIWHDAGDWPQRLPLLVQSLKQAGADIIILQEVLQDKTRALPNQAQTIADMLGEYSVHFFATEPPGSLKRYGNAILTRFPVMDEVGKKLEPLNDYRTALRLRMSVAGSAIDVVGTHLASQPDAGAVRTLQVNDLMDWLPRDHTPLIVAGDFNATVDEKALAPLTGPRFFSTLPQDSSTTTLNPAMGHRERVIDHIFAERKRFEPVAARRIGDVPEDGKYPSDHFGVRATLRVV